MKFSQKKKRKMLKMRQRRINQICKDMIGCTIDYENGYEVIDQAKINETQYLLTEIENKQFAIYKIVKVGKYVKLSEKKILQIRDALSNYLNWRNWSSILISDDGEIESVKQVRRSVSRFCNGIPKYNYFEVEY